MTIVHSTWKRPNAGARQRDILWYWVNERHAMYLRRRAGEPPPWTDDPIMAAYRFTNVFRRLDRVTQVLVKDLGRRESDGRRLFRVALFRLFNWPPTYALLSPMVGRWDRAAAERKLAPRRAAGEKLLTGVWMVSGAAAPGRPIFSGYLDSLSDFEPRASAAAARIKAGRSLELAHREVQAMPGVGPFVGWQMVLDLAYTPLLNIATDAEMYLYVGPGALRGLLRIDERPVPASALMTPRYPGGNVAAIERTKELQKESVKRRGRHVPPLTIHDIEHAVCESDKYARALRGEGRPRNRYAPGDNWKLPEGVY